MAKKMRAKARQMVKMAKLHSQGITFRSYSCKNSEIMLIELLCILLINEVSKLNDFMLDVFCYPSAQ